MLLLLYCYYLSATIAQIYCVATIRDSSVVCILAIHKQGGRYCDFHLLFFLSIMSDFYLI